MVEVATGERVATQGGRRAGIRIGGRQRQHRTVVQRTDIGVPIDVGLDLEFAPPWLPDEVREARSS